MGEYFYGNRGSDSGDDKSRPILFFDSGVGGLPYLLHAKKQLPNERFVYLADRKNFPYGEKSITEIKNAVFSALSSILKIEKPKLAVIACNTASVVTLASLRSKFKFPFVGVVPAVKPASRITRDGKIAVLATFRTTEDLYLQNLIDSFASDKEVKRFAEGNLVEFVEKNFFESSKKEKINIIENTLYDVKSNGFSTIVLGCTHFLLLEDELKKVLGNSVSIVDSREGVTNQLIRLLNENNLMRKTKAGVDKLYVTGNDPVEKRYKLFAEMFGLNSAERIL